ncbi:MAG: ATP-dependent metallopeptidase FtsH/Yme1/Tma family protein, partial [Planctomycetota bacterium]
MSDNQSKKPVPPRRGPQDRRDKKPPLPRYKRGPFTYLIIAIAIFTLMMTMNKFTRVEKIRWDEFVDHVENKNIDSVTVKDTEVTGQFNEEYTNSQEGKGKKSFVVYYNPEVHGPWLRELLEKNPDVDNDTAPQRIWLLLLMQWVLPLLLLIGFFYFVFARNLRGGAGGMLMSFGRSKHRLQGKDRAKVTFEDVAGVEEAKEEVAEIIEFLKNPKKFQRL